MPCHQFNSENHAVKTENAGFTLVELSIVLVILGLLVGGVITGRSLIRAAELRSVISDINKYKTAVMTFHNKYFALPGDMHNAERFWGSPSTGTCPTGSGTGTETCNGNGDGQIAVGGGANQFDERYTFWQHLANAELIEGSYSGKAGAGGIHDSISGQNTPVMKFSGATIYNSRYGSDGANTYWFPSPNGNVFFIGRQAGPTSFSLYNLFTTEEAWNIDKKIDDGKPADGKVITLKSTSGYITNCSTTADETTAEYNFSYNGNACSLIVYTGF